MKQLCKRTFLKYGLFCITIVFWWSSASAQYQGGVGKGNTIIYFSGVPLLSNSMYAGGSNDGHTFTLSLAVPLATTNTQYSGGSDDGVTLVNALALPMSSSSPYGGGSDDGSAIASASALFLNVATMYAGGGDDGFNALPANALALSSSSIYSGGPEDGVGIFSATSLPLNSTTMYAGGIDDGFSVGGSLAVPLSASSIYSGGGNDGYSVTYASASLVALPILWRDFTVVKKGQDALLHWLVSNEHPGDSYIAMRSFDGSNFEQIAFLTATFGNSSGNEYQYTDLAPAHRCNGDCKTAFYRITHLATDGRISYSFVRRVALDQVTGSIQVYPNPANTLLNIVFQNPADAVANIQLFNSIGSMMLHQQASTSQSISIDVSNLPAGIYVLRVVDAKQIFLQSIIISH